jgi:uncharacterized protein (TIGR03067 family)
MLKARWMALAAAALAMGVIGSHTCGSSAQEKAKSDRELIQGTWLAVSGERNGEKLNEFQLKNWEAMVFKDDTFTREGGEKKEGTFKLNAEKSPKQIDLMVDVKGQDVTWEGIYELKGDKLKLALAPNRPAEFDSTSGVVIVFERKK